MAVETVEVKKWWESKVNWVAILGIVAQMANFTGFIVPPDLIANVAVLLASVQSVLTVIARTWFSPTVVTQSVK